MEDDRPATQSQDTPNAGTRPVKQPAPMRMALPPALLEKFIAAARERAKLAKDCHRGE